MAENASHSDPPHPTTVAPDPNVPNQPKNAIMVTNPSHIKTTMALVPPPLLALPTDLLYVVATYLTIRDIRLFGRVSRRFYYFVAEWLPKYRYKLAVHRLPDTILSNIAKQLSSKRERNRFAQISPQLYPTVMKHTVLLAIKDRQNNFLIQAIKHNDMDLALKLSRLGADIHGADSPDRTPPLETAVRCGSEAMVRMLLLKGAQAHKSSILGEAIKNGREDIALLLWKGIWRKARPYPNWGHSCSIHGDSDLYLACKAGFVTLTKKMLHCSTLVQWRKDRIDIYTFELLRVLRNTACSSGSESNDRELPEGISATIRLFLQYGADPDVEYDWGRNTPCQWYNDDDDWLEYHPQGTIRQLGSQSPDVRIRDLVLGWEKAPIVLPGNMQDLSIIIGTRRNLCSKDGISWDLLNVGSGEDTDPDLHMWDIKKVVSSRRKLRNGTRRSNPVASHDVFDLRVISGRRGKFATRSATRSRTSKVDDFDNSSTLLFSEQTRVDLETEF